MILRDLRWGPACGSGHDITGKSMFCSLYFIISWAYLLGTGEGGVLPLIKQGNFKTCCSAKLQLYIMRLALCCFLNFPTVSFFSSSLWLEGLRVWCWSPCCLHHGAERPAKERETAAETADNSPIYRFFSVTVIQSGHEVTQVFQ